MREFAYINYPPDNWVKPVHDDGGKVILDVAVIGGGTCGMAATFGLFREGIRNVRLFDQNPAGEEGPWITTARMKTLRSPKHLTGPHMGLPNLTFRAWFEAKWGDRAWEELDKIPKEMWMDYLIWYRTVLKLPVENNKKLVSLQPAEGCFSLTFESKGQTEPIKARHVVLATGRAAFGGVSLPPQALSLPGDLYAHTEDRFDYETLRGKVVIVIGGAASAADSAATALEAGADAVHMLIRADQMPRLNKFKSIVYPGFMRGFSSLSPEQRWRFLKHGFDTRIAAPRSSMLRLKEYRNFHLHLGTPVEAFEQEGGLITARTPKGDIKGDFVIFGTGYAIDIRRQPEIAPFADDILLWRDCYSPEAGEADATLESYPYLGDGFQFLAKEGREAAYLGNLHLFNAATTLTHAPLSSDIPGVNMGVSRLVDHISKQLFTDAVDQHFEDFLAYDEPELLGDEWVDR